ncbi:MAG: metallophosphoesterase [Odoribacter sp.]
MLSVIKNKVGIWVIFALLLTGCNVFEYHPYEVRLSSKYEDTNAKNIARLKDLDKGKDTVRFAFMGDSQRWYDETEDFVSHVNKRNDVDFVIHGGDISDFGMQKEFCWVHDIMDKLKVPYVALIGNHDNLGSGEEIYQVMYGDLNFSFIYGGIKFVCLNTNALEFDYGTPVPDFRFIEREIADTVTVDYQQTIAVMHVEPGDVVFNNNVALVFHEYLKRFRHLRFCLHAHAHRLMVDDFFNDGMIYYGCAAMKNRNYMLFTVTPQGYSYEVVNY